MGKIFSKSKQVISCTNNRSKNDGKYERIEMQILPSCNENSNNSKGHIFVNFCKKTALTDDKVLHLYNDVALTTGLKQIQLYYNQ